ncbi:ATP-dependent helicase, partial [Mycobacterium tuberculosis]
KFNPISSPIVGGDATSEPGSGTASDSGSDVVSGSRSGNGEAARRRRRRRRRPTHAQDGFAARAN